MAGGDGRAGLYTGDTAPWQVFIHDGDDFGWAPGVAVSDTEKDAGETLFDPALLTFRYPYQRETTLPAKLTATQLKGRALDQEIAEDAYHTPYIRPLVQPKFRREKKGLTPAERGTATHLVLQYLDLQNLDVPGQVEKLRLEAKLTAEQAAAVDVPALRRFLESPLAEEMRQAETAAREYRFTVLMPARDYDPAAAEEDSILLQGVVVAGLKRRRASRWWTLRPTSYRRRKMWHSTRSCTGASWRRTLWRWNGCWKRR